MTQQNEIHRQTFDAEETGRRLMLGCVTTLLEQLDPWDFDTRERAQALKAAAAGLEHESMQFSDPREVGR